MREPVKPRYAVSMQIHFDQFGFSDKYENDEDSILDQMEKAVESLTEPVTGSPSHGKYVSGIVRLHVDDLFLRWRQIVI